MCSRDGILTFYESESGANAVYHWAALDTKDGKFRHPGAGEMLRLLVSSDPNIDHSVRGPATRARPSKPEPVATGSTAIGRERTDHVRHQDEHITGRMNRSAPPSDCQHDAAHKLLERFVRRNRARNVARSHYGEASGRHSSGGGDIDQASARDPYGRFARRCAGQQFPMLIGLMLKRHPRSRWLATTQAALDRLADDWKSEHE